MEQIKLSKAHPKIEFILNAEDSYLMIESVCVTSSATADNHWSNFISKVKLTAELKYIAYVDPEGQFIDERKKQFPIHLITAINQIQPIFQLELLIKNETFPLGINSEVKCYKTLKLALTDFENLEAEYTLALNIKKYKLGD